MKMLSWYQGLIDKAYERDGLTDRVLECQILLNRLRSRLDKTDDENVITDDGFVQ